MKLYSPLYHTEGSKQKIEVDATQHTLRVCIYDKHTSIFFHLDIPDAVRLVGMMQDVINGRFPGSFYPVPEGESIVAATKITTEADKRNAQEAV